jgi:hypothetical protein
MEHKIYPSTSVKGHFALDTPDGPTLSNLQVVTLRLGSLTITGCIRTDYDTSWFLPDGGRYLTDKIELREGITVEIDQPQKREEILEALLKEFVALYANRGSAPSAEYHLALFDLCMRSRMYLGQGTIQLKQEPDDLYVKSKPLRQKNSFAELLNNPTHQVYTVYLDSASYDISPNVCIRLDDEHAAQQLYALAEHITNIQSDQPREEGEA